MYLIVVYDISVDRVNKVHKYLKQFLHWIQNSVFEGELTESEFRVMKNGLKDIIKSDEDFVLIYVIKMKKQVVREKMGPEKNPIGFVL